MSKIDFTDATGAATLESPMPGTHGKRFWRFEPGWSDEAARAVSVGTGATSVLQYREDYTAEVEIRNLDSSDISIALRLKKHLMAGGTVTVTLSDQSSHVYTCRLQPGTVPLFRRMGGEQVIEYFFQTTLKNTAAAAMLVDYE